MSKPQRQALGRSPTAHELAELTRLYGEKKYAEAKIRASALAVRAPRHPFAWKVLGVICQEQLQFEESLTATRRAIVLEPHDAALHNNLGTALQKLDRRKEAEVSFRKALRIAPDYAKALLNLSVLLKEQGELESAESCCRRALAADPHYFKIQHTLGDILRAQNRMPAAIASFNRAVELKPDSAESLFQLCTLLNEQGSPAVALAYYQRALEFALDDPNVHARCATLRDSAGHPNDAQATYRKVMALQPDWAVTHSNFLFFLSHNIMADAPTLFAEHLNFGDRFEAPLREDWRSHANDKSPERQLQVGFISSDFKNHAVVNFIEPVLQHLCRSESLSLHAYHASATKDTETSRLSVYFAHWHPVALLGPAELAAQIRADGIDVLIDLSGHTAGNRLPTFARKPAPIQATWIGYPGTTGLQAMDYYLCDRYLAPKELDWQLTEKTAYLPASAVFLPYSHAPEVDTLPALRNGYITFGSFNRVDKLNPSVIALWSMLLCSIPTAKLLVGATPDHMQPALLQRFAEHGVDAARLSFAPRTTMQEYLTLHHQVDICLDTFPYGGGTTSCHSLWMGVPTLTLAGETIPSRVGATLMGQLNLDQFIATSIEDFVEKGAYWDQHLDELAALRTGMRSRFLASPLSQPERIAAHLEKLLRTMWKRWCQDLPPAHLE